MYVTMQQFCEAIWQGNSVSEGQCEKLIPALRLLQKQFAKPEHPNTVSTNAQVLASQRRLSNWLKDALSETFVALKFAILKDLAFKSILKNLYLVLKVIYLIVSSPGTESIF